MRIQTDEESAETMTYLEVSPMNLHRDRRHIIGGGRGALAAAVLAILPATHQAFAATPVIDHYISTGDNFFVGSFLPVDSPAAINASFDLIRDVYGTRRIYWRGLQESLYIQTPPRPENPVVYNNLAQSRDLIENQNINQVAVQAAHSRGMQIWGLGSIYDWGVAAKDPIFFGYPGDHEHPLRVDHPEWVPVDKYGDRRQGGPIELAYPDARQALVNWHVNEVVQAGYDGMVSHSYNENYTMRFQDEFGFSDPIVNEFKNRYGVDIRRESFNRQNWYDLRGEYTTQFLSELHTALAAAGKKLGMPVNAATGSIDKPRNWEGFMTAGNITQNWRSWASNHYVDELMIWGSSDIAFNTVKDETQGTGVPISLLTSEIYFPPLAPILNSGAPVVGAYSYDEDYLLRSNIPAQPLSSLSSPDQYKQMRVLAQIIAGSTTATSADVLPLVNHPNLIARRLALRALGKLGDPASVPTLEAALSDPENAIRTAAVYALIDENRPESAQVILNAVAAHGNQVLMEGSVAALRTISSASPTLLNAIQNSPNGNVRSVAMRALAQQGNFAITAAMLPTLTTAMNDSEEYVRAYAVDAISRVGASNTAVQTLIDNVTTSSDPILSNRSAMGLNAMLRAFDPAAAARRADIINGMETLLRKFGDASTRSDKDWGYIPAGNAMYDLVPDGRLRLRTLMNQRIDRKLSEQSWEVLHLHQKPGQFVTVTEADDAYAHFKRPRWNTVVGASDSFNLKAEGSLIHNQKAEIGQTWLVTQGNSADQVVQSAVNNGGRALRAIRRAGGSHEIRLAGDAWDAQAAEISLVTAKADWLRNGALDAAAFGLDIGAGIEAQISVDANSNYRVWQTDGSASGGSYLQTNVQAGVGGWETIEIALTWNAANGSLLTGTYDVFLSRDSANSLGQMSRTMIAQDVPVHSVSERTLQQLFISNQPNGASDVTTWWDNVSLTVGRVLPSIPGDADLNGVVDVNDLGILASNWQQPANWLGADFTGDGFVNVADLGLLASNWQAGVAGASFADAMATLLPGVSVPEPAVMSLLGAYGLLCGRRARRRYLR
jgi:hypothetical protein